MAFVAAHLDVLMFLGLCAAILSGVPVVFVLTGIAIVFGAIGWAMGVFSPSLLIALPGRIWGTMTSEVLIAIPLFVFMGIALERSKIAEELLESIGRLFGPVRGGLAISVTLVGALLAASTGIIGATVVTMGMMALPSMLRRGYNPAFCCGSICAAGTLGQIIPPSTVMVILGEILSAAYQQAQFAQGKFNVETVSVGQLFAGALFPGLLLVGLYIVYQLTRAFLEPRLAPALPRRTEEERVRARPLLGSLLPPIILIVVVLGSILGGVATPTEAAAIGASGAAMLAAQRVAPARSRPIYVGAACVVGVLVLSSFFDLRLGREATPSADRAAIYAAGLLSVGVLYGLAVAFWQCWRHEILVPVMRSTMIITSMIFAMLIGATLFALVFRGLGGDETVERILSAVPGGTAGALAGVMVAIFLLGFFLDFVEIAIIVIPLVGPVLMGAGVDPIWFGVLVAINLQTSFLTPPFGFALFYLRGVAPPEVRTSQIYRGVMPFVALQLLGLLLVALNPGLATWLPERLFG